MQIIRKASFKASPWKNGGGVTHEVIRVPPGCDAFQWRVSVAQIEASGPFSDFAEYHRKMVLLRGAGVRLTFDGRNHCELREVGDMAEFDGACATRCELKDGPCADLNLMVSKSITGVRAWTLRLHAGQSLRPHRATMLAFAISGTVSLDTGEGAITSLQEWDLAVAVSGDHVVVGPAVPHESSAPLVFFAALDDNSP
jgi:environmental stress-induced protein Ves